MHEMAAIILIRSSGVDTYPASRLVKYTVTVEFENGEDIVMKFDVIAPTTTATVPGDYLDSGLEGKVEIGAVL